MTLDWSRPTLGCFSSHLCFLSLLRTVSSAYAPQNPGNHSKPSDTFERNLNSLQSSFSWRAIGCHDRGGTSTLLPGLLGDDQRHKNWGVHRTSWATFGTQSIRTWFHHGPYLTCDSSSNSLDAACRIAHHIYNGNINYPRPELQIA